MSQSLTNAEAEVSPMEQRRKRLGLMPGDFLLPGIVELGYFETRKVPKARNLEELFAPPAEGNKTEA